MSRWDAKRWIAKRWVQVVAVLLALPILLALYIGLTFAQVLAADGTNDPQPADAIVVLGAAQYNGNPSPVLARRLDRAYDLWRADIAPLVVTTGSKQEGDAYTEGYAGYAYLRYRNLPESAVLVVDDGASTWEQLAATARVLKQRGLDEVVLVSDPYHAMRLRQIADEVGLSASIASTAGSSSFKQLVRETAAVSLGRIVGYRRVDNWFGSVG
jgi:uncharacterized SAM-binding protein YcdF (DUF218 family)